MIHKSALKLATVIAALILMLALTGCEPTYYTVSFQVGDHLYTQQSVEEEKTATAVTPEIPGVTFIYWADADGQKVQPETVTVLADATYTAVVRPNLSKHVPVLYVDREGKLNAEHALKGEDLIAALKALAADGAQAHFPELPYDKAMITSQTLKDTLNCFIEESAVTEATKDLSGNTVTRRQFAKVMLTLLDRAADKKIAVAENAALPADINAMTEDVAMLLEAVMPHADSEAGILWAEYELPTGLSEGFHFIDGWTYYVQESGYLLKDSSIGTLTFDANGRFTSGDAALDKLVADILKTMIAENPDKDRYELLYQAHLYCRDSFKYLRRYVDNPAFGTNGWEIENATVMFTTGRGNCYNYAASFWALARALGYDARAVSGTCTGTNQPHGWCFIEFDGKDYIFDCEWEMAYRERGVFNKNMFKVPKEKWSFWTYRWKK